MLSEHQGSPDRPDRLAPGLWRIATAANCYVWSSGQGVTIIDPGLPTEASGVLQSLQQLFPHEDVAAIVVTHWHADHSGAAPAVAQATGAPVLAGAADAAVLRGQTPPAPPALRASEQELYAQITAAAGVTTQPPHIPQAQDLLSFIPRLKDMGIAPHLIGGHTPGSIALHLPGVAAVLTGDVARTDDNGRLALGLFHTDPPTALAALRLLASLNPVVAGVGHGRPQRAGAAQALRAAALAAGAPSHGTGSDEDRSTTQQRTSS